jgi:L-alanine-DL-glutamate epimerase-like enolase superfamily enzyme
MKIARIETFYVPPRWLFVRVEADEGAVGWGEASLEGWAEAVDGATVSRTSGRSPIAAASTGAAQC